MNNSQRFWRGFTFIMLIAALCGLSALPIAPFGNAPAYAAPQMQAIRSVVISEFRTQGSGGANDEFVELYNPTNTTINIGGWTIRKSSGCGGTTTILETIPAGTSLNPGQYYLSAGLSYSGGTTPDYQHPTNWSIADDGGVAILNSLDVIMDQVGMCASTLYLEVNPLTPMSSSVNQSYERKVWGSAGNCNDTDNNATDFVLNPASSNPQNLSSAPVSCIGVTNVTSSIPDGIYSSTSVPNVIDIEIRFSGIVNVNDTGGSPTILLETGTTDRTATYASGNGSDTLVFNYTIMPGDVSSDLDYVATNSLSLNGGTITGATGDAVLILPSPGSAGSLGASKNIVIDNGIPPAVTVDQAPAQVDPTSTLPINFTVLFSEPINVSTFTVSDITPGGTATGITWNITDSGDHKTFTLSATAVTGAGTLIPSIAANLVTDPAGTNNTASTSITDNTVTYTIASALSILINEVAWTGTGASTSDEWIELYNPGTTAVNLTGWVLKAVDGTPNIALTGTLPPGGFYLLESREDAVIDVTANQLYSGALANSDEIIQLFSPSNQIIDTANSNGGAWPAGSTSTFGTMERRGVVADSDTAWITNVQSSTWTRHDARGTGSTNYLIHGTPGYANWATSVTPTFSPTPTRTRTPSRTPTKVITRTPTPAPPPPLVAINEFVPRPGHDWNNDGVVNTGDEYIEILNHGVIDVNLSGYRLDDEANIGSDPYSLPSVVIKPGERIVFYGSDTGLLLSDGGDGVRLLKPNGQLADAYNYFVVRFPDQSYCRLPDNGGLDDWNRNCFPTPGLQNSLSGSSVNPPTTGGEEPLCPIADTLPADFVYAECSPFGHNIWNSAYWDRFGWFDEKYLPESPGKWPLFAD